MIKPLLYVPAAYVKQRCITISVGARRGVLFRDTKPWSRRVSRAHRRVIENPSDSNTAQSRVNGRNTPSLTFVRFPIRIELGNESIAGGISPTMDLEIVERRTG